MQIFRLCQGFLNPELVAFKAHFVRKTSRFWNFHLVSHISFFPCLGFSCALFFFFLFVALFLLGFLGHPLFKICQDAQHHG
jgi:hypothetical protein